MVSWRCYTRVNAIFGDGFRSAFIIIDDKYSFLLFDEADAHALELCVSHLKGAPRSTRTDFYRNLIENQPLRGPDGLLVKFATP